jgi:hypothetical protein
MQQIISNTLVPPMPVRASRDIRLALRAAAQVEAAFGTRLLLPGLATCRDCAVVMVPWPWLNKGPVYACHNQRCDASRLYARDADAAAWRLLQAEPVMRQALAPFKRATDILRILRGRLELVLIDTRPGGPLPIELRWSQLPPKGGAVPKWSEGRT